MIRYTKLAVVAAFLLIASSCGGEGEPRPEATGGNPPSSGGTLRLQTVPDVSAAFDPQKEYFSLSFEYFRCCLLRTLLSTNGLSAEQGGNELHPDLAAAPPDVSPDGLEWTFRLKTGISYAPPLQDVTVTSQDFIRALEREACTECATGGYSFYYSVIEGFDELSAGKADSISGLSAPDESTLVVKLTEPAGDLGYRFAMAATAPIPPNPSNPDARLGVAEGHTQDYGRFLATTGPYMFEGQDQLDYSAPARKQQPIPGYQPGRSITFVRNPSWSKSTDALRPAYADRIEITIGGTTDDIANKVQAGDVDVMLETPPPRVVRTFSTDQNLENRLFTHFADAVEYLSFNLALPPFDDIHVRKAVNLVIDKDALRRLEGGASMGEIATHAIVPTLLTVDGKNLLEGYDPYPSPGFRGDVEAAKAEMRQSRYDTDADGVCDAEECEGVLAVTEEREPAPGEAALIQESLQDLGIDLEVKVFELNTMFAKCNDPGAKVAFCLGAGWAKDYPDAYTWTPLFDSSGIYPSCCNLSLVGASPELLEKHDYEITEVPSADAEAEACAPLTGDERVRCWANYDKFIMEEIVPWVPLTFPNQVHIVSERVSSYAFDSFASTASLDHIALKRGAR